MNILATIEHGLCIQPVFPDNARESMKKFPTRNEIRDMKFSSLACRVHDWIHSMARSVINKTQKTECAGVISLLEAKLQDEPENASRARVVEKLRRDLNALLTYAEATKRRSAPAGRVAGIDSRKEAIEG